MTTKEPSSLTSLPSVKLPGAFTHAAITGTLDGITRWSQSAATAERLKVFCQVMCGFEIIAVKTRAGVTANGKANLDSHNGNPKVTAEQIVEAAGVPSTTLYRWEQMARACAPRLKKLPTLRDFDPFSAPLSQLPPVQLESLSTAVRKLTDGKTQQEFGESLGLWKKPAAGPGRKPGDGGRDATAASPEAARLARIKMAREDLALAHKHLLAPNFVVLPDEDRLAVEALCTAYEQRLKAMRLWLSTPAADRDPKFLTAIEKLLK